MSVTRTLAHTVIAVTIGMSPFWLPLVGVDVVRYFPNGRIGSAEMNAFKFTAFLCFFYMMGVTWWSSRN
jgi:hypothetical protein